MQSNRLHQLDWLRVIAIGLLILFHIGMVYVPDWGFHFKHEASSDGLKNLLLTLSPWRMGLLWLISGVALRHMWNKRSDWQLILTRSTQLLLPLLIGVLVIVPPQLYIEMTQAGKMPLDFGDFLFALYVDPKHYFDDYQSGIWPHFDVNHLWFLRSLWQYSVILLLLAPLLTSRWGLRVTHLLSGHLKLQLGICIVSILLIETLLEGEQIREIYGFYLLLFGFLLGSHHLFWQKLKASWLPITLLALSALILLQFVFEFIWQTGPLQENRYAVTVGLTIYALAKTLPVFAVAALASRFLQQESSIIRKLNLWVFPIYILHQSIIIVVAYYLTQYQLPLMIEGILVTILTCLTCYLAIVLLKQSPLLQPMFGIRLITKKPLYHSPLWRYSITISCIPIMLALIS
ncbi:acyltransferase family protein [Shewanella nanhaiensis]|uniref:Acyltransferase n=1 Tax=Shewanella nanhaiensis TaxID=2864872 RepID=A0ABS7E1M8_9GAMM|nr:acyltransferase family protein [Shewanella nanhaiensis]MBW8183543.1 acyltransferase [Shewanella nanhaiensis]